MKPENAVLYQKNYQEITDLTLTVADNQNTNESNLFATEGILNYATLPSRELFYSLLEFGTGCHQILNYCVEELYWFDYNSSLSFKLF
ncbi:Protein of unknown function [Cotesia congregata]|uniref:Uncharacterized protein n=1 Tax=Cotesia congregata TaxID=51543 RepID=A0A8J2EDK6_COTCN|nr:Protein of unknown function [Cotesia congregata]